MRKSFLFYLLLATLLTSCRSSHKILYFQDATVNRATELEAIKEIQIEPKDKIAIAISSKDPQLAALFNLTQVSYSSNTVNQSKGGGTPSGQSLGYTVSNEGSIDFPVLGTIHVAGLTKSQIAALVKKQLIDGDLIKDPVVTVEFMNLSVYMLGEVGSPGRLNIDKDRFTLLEAISMSGDLTIHGKRDGVFVIREEAGKRITHRLDLRASEELLLSPAFYLKQNDIVYVQPNKVRAGQSTINDNSLQSIPMWMSIVSFLTTFGLLIFN